MHWKNCLVKPQYLFKTKSWLYFPPTPVTIGTTRRAGLPLMRWKYNWLEDFVQLGCKARIGKDAPQRIGFAGNFLHSKLKKIISRESRDTRADPHRVHGLPRSFKKTLWFFKAIFTFSTKKILSNPSKGACTYCVINFCQILDPTTMHHQDPDPPTPLKWLRDMWTETTTFTKNLKKIRGP